MANWWDSSPIASPLDVGLYQEGISGPLAALARSVYHQESSSGKNAQTSNAGAVGGMQILPGTFAEVADDGWDINDPVQNARAGIRYLNKMYELGGNDPRMAAIGYYGGPGAIKAAKAGQSRSDPRNPQAPNTFQYADQVVSRLPREPGLVERAVNAVIPAAQAETIPQGNWWDQYETVEPAAQSAQEQQEQPGFIDRLGRQVGLTARYGLEGLGQVADVFTEPLRQAVVNPAARALGLPEATESTSQMATRGADSLGLPRPQGAMENVVGDAARLMAGAGGLSGASGALARGATGALQAGLQGLAVNPAQQIVSAAGAGGAGGAAREAGAPAPVQMAASLAGGLAAPAIMNRGQTLAQGLSNRISAMRPDQVLDRVKTSLAQNGVEWNQIPPRVQQQLLAEAQAALRSGDLNPQALSRLADFQRIQGTTPTRGMLTQQPGDVTREMNLAKLQAQIGNDGLPGIQNQNNAALVRALNEFNPQDQAVAGQGAVNALQSRLNAQRSNINNLYSQARDSAGRSFPLDGRAFADRAIQALDDNLVGGALPADVRNHINRISRGEVPFTVDYAEQLKTLMARLQRGTSDGSARYALGLVRQALDDTPILGLGGQTAATGARAVNPGMLPAEAGNPTAGEQAIEAFNRARGANSSLMRQIENTPALRALESGNLAPEQFVQKFIASQSASNADVRRLGRLLAGNQPARESVRSGIVQHLKDRALSGKPDDIGAAKFSADQYAKALKSLGDGKLSAFFDPSEIQQLHAISRVGRLMVNQPIGSAVNNSNTAAAAIGRILDMMGSAGRGFKILGIGDQIKAIEAALGQRKALNAGGALVLPKPPQQSAAIPAAVYGSVLATVPPREDNRSQ